MKILSIETSCDDTGIAILDVHTTKKAVDFTILGATINSQIELHRTYGGVFPMMAKREHGKNMIPTLTSSLLQAKLIPKKKVAHTIFTTRQIQKIRDLLQRENDLVDPFIEFITTTSKPDIDMIAVTTGPGLEPALWVGISTAKALSYAWDIPIIPVNHMEGHVLSILASKKKTFTYTKDTLVFPLISLLVSGGHTEIVVVKKFGDYTVIGQTRDDAAGEAFDKVARMLDLPYPGGPEISRLAKEQRESVLSGSLTDRVGGSREIFQQKNIRAERKYTPSESRGIIFPRPMIHSGDFDFSFSGLKTAVLYYIRDNGPLDKDKKKAIACEFEDAVIEVLTHKTLAAIKKHKAQTLIVGGGVSANTLLKDTLIQKTHAYDKSIQVHFPTQSLATDNAVMIAIAGYFHSHEKKAIKNFRSTIKANGNLTF